jgi:outer membrane protein TolC
MKILVYILFLLISFAYSKEIFKEEYIKDYLNDKNPYFKSITVEKDIFSGKLQYYQGNFNFKLKGKYEDKDYPISYGNYRGLFLEKPTFQGFDLLFGYRKAQGVQEYSNIKTGKDGEVIFGIKLPIIAFLNSIDKRRLDYYNAKIELNEKTLDVIQNVNDLYIKIISSYYDVLYKNEILELEKKLLQKAENRKNFIKRKVEEGSLPKITLVEANQQILKRKQRVIKAKNEFNISLNNFLRYLNLDKEEFLKKYTLPSLPDVENKDLDFNSLYKIALNNNLKIKIINQKKEKINNNLKYTETLKYPDINLGLYAVNDFKYHQGYKVSLDFSFYPVNDKYIGKKVELTKKLVQLKNKEETIRIELKTKILNYLDKLKALKENIKLSLETINLLKSVEDAEVKKFEAGLSDLFYVNQREIYTLEGMKTYLEYKKDFHITLKKLMLEVNPYMIINF